MSSKRRGPIDGGRRCIHESKGRPDVGSSWFGSGARRGRRSRWPGVAVRSGSRSTPTTSRSTPARARRRGGPAHRRRCPSWRRTSRTTCRQRYGRCGVREDASAFASTTAVWCELALLLGYPTRVMTTCERIVCSASMFAAIYDCFVAPTMRWQWFPNGPQRYR